MLETSAYSSQSTLRIFMTSLIHYVYRITNIITKKHYYGKRSSKIDPKLDLGIKYFSSSKDSDFRKDQKLNPHHYKYKIVAKFSTAMEAIIRESKLHYLFNVGKNENFYNKANQRINGFDTTGTSPSIETRNKIKERLTGKPCHENSRIGTSKRWKGIPKSAEQKLKMSNSAIGKKKSKESIAKTVAGKLGVLRSEEQKVKLTGINRESFSGYYILPNNITDARKELNLYTLSKNWCINSSKVISKSAYNQSQFLKNNYSWVEVKGKTFEEIGFGFIPKELIFPIIWVLFIRQPTYAL